MHNPGGRMQFNSSLFIVQTGKLDRRGPDKIKAQNRLGSTMGWKESCNKSGEAESGAKNPKTEHSNKQARK